MDTAERFSQLSSAKRLQVGAVLVKDHRVISIGYNGTPSGWDNRCEEVVSMPDWAASEEEIPEADRHIYCTYKTKKEVIHAEANAISKLARSSESGLGSTLFVTHAPCLDCAKLIYRAGVEKVYYRNSYRETTGVEFLEKCLVKVEQVVSDE